MKFSRVFSIAAVLGLPCPLFAQSATVPKTNPIPVYVQIMPWFQTPETLGAGNWGWHWTMNNQNPNTFQSNGERNIASHYYPAIGPYDSSDPYVIEYQMLSMKLSGVTGTIIDWYGQQGTNGDIQPLLTASNDIASATQTYGLQLGICLEDRFASSTSQVTANINYAASHYFNQSNYIKVGTSKSPMTMVFGPITYQQPSQWSTILSSVTVQPAIIPLQYQASQVGSPATGEFGWVYQDSGTSDNLTVQQNFLSQEASKFKTSFGVAYAGYNDFYAAGGDPSAASGFTIPQSDSNGQTLNETLALNQTYSKNIAGIQVATWNDYGEGTQIEPTLVNGQPDFTDLEELQQFTGVPYGVSQLQLVYSLYEAREQFLGNSQKEALLSGAANDLNNLDFGGAQNIIDQATGVPAPTWAINGSGNWNTAGNWGGAVPNGIDAVANLLGAITANHTVYTNTPITVGTIVFNNSAASYAIAGAVGASLMLQVSTGNALIDVQAGTHEINLPLILASNTTFQTDATTAHLIIADPMTINSGVALTTAGTGTVTYESTVTLKSGATMNIASSTQAPALSLATGATATLTSNTSGSQLLLQLASLSNNGTLNTNNNDVIIHGGTSLATVTAEIASGYSGGTWTGTGITSASAAGDTSHLHALGVAPVTTAGTFDGAAVAVGDVEVKYTYYGDANLDGTVTAADYLQIDSGFNSQGGGSPLTGWFNGDFNYDGKINGDDYTLIDNAFNTQGAQISSVIATSTAQIAGVSAVPEPATIGLLGIASAGMLARRRRRNG